MKFITEDDLRIDYHQFPFDTFTITKEQRLTPGARTFLLDRKVKIVDESEVASLKKAKQAYQKEAIFHLTNQEEDWRLDPSWLDIRCQFLEAAVELASLDLSLAQELSALERFLARILADEECLLPPISNASLAEEKVEPSFIHDNLSNVGMFLQTSNGRLLTNLYPLYFHLEQIMERWQLQEVTQMLDLRDRLGQLIAYYLKTREEVNNDVTRVT